MHAVPGADRRQRPGQDKGKHIDKPPVPSEDAGQKPRKRVCHGIKKRPLSRYIHRKAEHRSHRRAGEHSALHGGGHHQQQREETSHRHHAEQDHSRKRHQRAGGHHHQGYPVLEFRRFGGPQAAVQRVTEEVGSAEGKRKLQKQRRRCRRPALQREAAEKARQTHDEGRCSRHEKFVPINAELMKDEGNGVHQHGGRNIADAPFQAAAEKIAAARAKKRKHTADPRARACHQRHPEGRAVAQNPRAGHHRPHQQIQPAAGGDEKAAVHPLSHGTRAHSPSLSPEIHVSSS